MGWPSFVGARDVMNGGELSDWMKISKSNEQKGKKGKNMKKKNTEIYIQDKKGENGHALGQILKQALETHTS